VVRPVPRRHPGHDDGAGQSPPVLGPARRPHRRAGPWHRRTWRDPRGRDARGAAGRRRRVRRDVRSAATAFRHRRCDDGDGCAVVRRSLYVMWLVLSTSVRVRPKQTAVAFTESLSSGMLVLQPLFLSWFVAGAVDRDGSRMLVAAVAFAAMI